MNAKREAVLGFLTIAVMAGAFVFWCAATMSERSAARSPSALPAPSPHPTPIPVPPAPLLSVYNASPKIEPESKDSMLERCQMGGGIPVMGYGWRVVCLKPASAEWWDDLKIEEKKP